MALAFAASMLLGVFMIFHGFCYEDLFGELSSCSFLLGGPLLKDEELEVFTSFASFVFVIVENCSLLVVLKDSTQVLRTSNAPPVLPSQLQRI